MMNQFLYEFIMNELSDMEGIATDGDMELKIKELKEFIKEQVK